MNQDLDQRVRADPRVRLILEAVEQQGENGVRKNHVFGDVLQRGLAYGLKYGLFNQTDISGAQRKFETSHSLR